MTNGQELAEARGDDRALNLTVLRQESVATLSNTVAVYVASTSTPTPPPTAALTAPPSTQPTEGETSGGGGGSGTGTSQLPFLALGAVPLLLVLWFWTRRGRKNLDPSFHTSEAAHEVTEADTPLDESLPEHMRPVTLRRLSSHIRRTLSGEASRLAPEGDDVSEASTALEIPMPLREPPAGDQGPGGAEWIADLYQDFFDATGNSAQLADLERHPPSRRPSHRHAEAATTAVWNFINGIPSSIAGSMDLAERDRSLASEAPAGWSDSEVSGTEASVNMDDHPRAYGGRANASDSLWLWGHL